jgi:ATP-dependent Lon protease
VVFITTANMLDTIPGPLRDRMEVISLAGYTASEKFEIARRYLLRRQMEANGLKEGQVEITDEALREIIQHYTREAGVRNLEREIGRALRHAAVEVAQGNAREGHTIRIDVGDLAAILGGRRIIKKKTMHTSVPGLENRLH